MFGRILRMRGIIPVILILAAFCYWRLHPGPRKLLRLDMWLIVMCRCGIRSHSAPARWEFSTTANVSKLCVRKGHRHKYARIRAPLAGFWTTRQLMDPPLWEQSNALLARARTMPVQARGQTKTVSNVRAEPGRNAKRIFQIHARHAGPRVGPDDRGWAAIK